MKKDEFIRKVVKVERVIDGDTIIAWLDKGDYETKRYYLRFLGVNTPERGREGYYEAKEFVSQALEGAVVNVQTVKDKSIDNMDGYGTGGFGRYLATVFVGEGEDQYNLNEKLLELGLARVYAK